MLDNIKNFVKSVSSTTWMIVGVGVFAFIVLSLTTCHGKAVEVNPAAPAAVEAPAAK
jgi:hypothetical protein